LASGAIQVEYPDEAAFDTAFDPVNMDLVFKSEYKVTNKGFYDLEGLDIKAHLYTLDGKLLIVYRSQDLKVPRFSTRTFPIEARLPIERALQMDLRDFLINGSTFVLKVGISAYYVMGLVQFQLHQVRDYPWEPPLSQYQELLEDGSLVAMVMDLLQGRYSDIGKRVETAVVGAVLAQGQEAVVPLNRYSELVIEVDGADMCVKVQLMSPFQGTLLEYHVPLNIEDGQSGGDG